MTIKIEYANSAAGNALADISQCLQQANGSDQDRLYRLLFRHFNGTLRSKSEERLNSYLESLSVWRKHGPISVYKTSELPCVAYTALEHADGTSILILGACLAYPGSPQEWWENVIEPRLIDHL